MISRAEKVGEENIKLLATGLSIVAAVCVAIWLVDADMLNLIALAFQVNLPKVSCSKVTPIP
jgi:hypothetical protein